MAYKSGHIYMIDHEPNGEELANFSKPVQFDICKNGLYYSILFDKNGNKYVEDRSLVVTGFIKIGEIVQVGSQITIGVHPSGFNHWRINGVDITRSTPITLEVDAVPDGQFRIDNLVGNQAGGIFILPGTAGKFPIGPNPLDYPNLAFFLEIHVTPDNLGGGLVELNLSNIFSGNGANIPLDVNEASAEQRGTMSSAHWSKLEGINLSDYALNTTVSNKLDKATTVIPAPTADFRYVDLRDENNVGRRFFFKAFLDGNYASLVDLSSKLDKMTASSQTVLSSVTFSGNISAPKVILQDQASNTTVGAIWGDGTYTYYNGSGGTPKKIAYDADKINNPVSNGTFAVQKNGNDVTFVPTSGSLENLFFDQNARWAFPNSGLTTYTTIRTGGITQAGQFGRTNQFVPIIDYTFNTTTLIAFRRGATFDFFYSRTFKFIQQFDINSSVATTRLLVGLSNMFGTANPTNVSLDTLIRTVGVCKGSSNLAWIWNDSTGSANIEDMGSGFPANDFNSIYRLTIENTTAGASLLMKIERINKVTGVVTSLTKIITSDFNVPERMFPILYCCDSASTGTGTVGDYGIIGYINIF